MGCSPVLLKWFFHLSLFTAFSLLAAASESDKSALVEFKSSIYDPSGVLSGWNSGNQSHCLWYGVMCDLNSRVVGLNISGGGEICAKVDEFPLYGYGIKRNCEGRRGKLVGKISSSISRLSEIRVLSLAFNEFSGEIPCEIWGMEKLEVLDLEGNLINGSLPVRFDGLRRLRVLNLGFNKIEGEIPDSLSGLAGLEVLNLAGNRVNGSVPGWVGWVRSVYLSFNRLGGSIPVEIGKNCAKLEYLDLSSNYLVHTIPGSLGNCSQMRMLLLYSNMLDESIPFELGKLKNLEVLDLSRNTLSGPIPPQLGNCSELSVLVLKNLFDPAPRISRDPSDMEGSSDSEFNLFEGGIPTEIAVLPKLEILWAPRANLEGNLTRNWGACDNLEMVNLAENCFTGDIPAGLSSCKKLQFLDLSSNRLNGELNDGLPVACMNVFDVSGNLLMGSIPKFDNSSTCAFAPPVTGMIYNLSDPAAAYRSFFYSQSLKKAPLTLYNGANSLAVFHNFGSNLFSGAFGSIPLAGSRLGKQTVYAYSVGGNGFTGSFPVSLFEKCDELGAILVNVSNNKIFAQLPPDIGSMCSSLVLLDASRNQIDGSIPPSLGSSESLVALNLSDNLFRGQIPSSLSQARSLKNLSLANNKLTGIIPPSLVQLHSLEVLELSSNGLSGVIPKNLVNMKNLTVLLLDNNKLSGKLPPELSSMTALASFNVSFNNLSGPIPSSSNMIKCSSFVGNHYLEPCPVFSLSGPPVDKQGTSDDPQNYAGSPSESLNGDTKNVRFNSIEIAAITSASAIFSVLVALTILFIYTRKCSRKSKILATTRKELTTFADIGVPLTFETVVRATGNFNVSNCIGHGGFGATYKAEIAPGVLVAVKRLSVGRFQGVQQFHVEIKTLGRHRHPNLVTLIGYHASETEMFLIYNFLPGGNLEKFIQERSTRAVDWRILHKIALDIARALAYLHDECVPRVLHRDVKPSNILLDEDLNAYLSDFGLARLLGTSETHATTGVAGTFGYVAPEYAMTCRVSDKADVYSYGVVLLELLSDKKALDPSFCSYGYGFNIVHWASMLLRQGRAKELFTAGLWDKGHHDDLVEVLHLAVVCTEDSLSTRPTMRKVVRRLKELQPPSC